MVQNIKILLFFFTLFLTFCAPTKEPPTLCDNPPCDNNPTLESKLLWFNPTMADTSEMLISHIVTNDSKIFYVRQREAFEGTVVARESSTGKLLWEWGDPNIAEGYDISSLLMVDGKLIVDSWADLYVLDMQTGNTIWKASAHQLGGCGHPRISVIGNHIYFVIGDCSADGFYSQIMRTPIDHFSPEVIYRIDQITTSDPDSGWVSGLERPALWLNPQNDSVLIFQDRAFKLGVLQNEIDLFAYDLKTKTLLWKIDSVTIEGISSTQLISIEDNFIYFLGFSSLHKINILSGEKIWSKSFPGQFDHFVFSDIIKVGNTIYTHPGGHTFFAINSETGEEEWHIDPLGCCGFSGKMAFINNHLYYTTPPYFLNIDVDKMSVVSKDESPLKFGMNLKARFSQFSRTISSPDKKLLFISDNHYIMAIKVD